MGEEGAMTGEEDMGDEVDDSVVETRESNEAAELQISPWSSEEEGMMGEEAMGCEEEGSIFVNEGSSGAKLRKKEEVRSE